MGMRILLGISLVVLIALVLQTVGDMLDPISDYDSTVPYWVAARLNLQGRNMYDPEEVMLLQRSVGCTYEHALLLYDLPYELSILAVIGVFPFPFARAVWLMLNLILFILAGEWMWFVYAGPERRWIAWIVTVLFLPVALTLKAGQNIAFVTMGASLFLLGMQNKQHWLAGLGIALMTIKPNLYWMVWPALLLFSEWKTIVHAMAWVAFFMTIGILTNPALPLQFIEGLGRLPTVWMPETIGGVMRLQAGSELAWVQFLPMIPGVLWFVWYMNRHQLNTWREIFPDLILASFVFAPYGFAYSLAATLPAIIQTVATCICRRRFIPILSLFPVIVAVALHSTFPASVTIVAVSVVCWRWLNLRPVIFTEIQKWKRN